MDLCENKAKKSKGLFGFLKSKGKLWLLCAGATLGLLLLLVGGQGNTDKTNTVEGDAQNEAAISAYCTALEDELEHLCEAVSGVSDVRIMITLARGYRTEFVTDASGEAVVVGGGSSAHLTEQSLSPPTVSGVGVVCRGGSSARVQKELVELISTTLGISASRVFVTGK